MCLIFLIFTGCSNSNNGLSNETATPKPTIQTKTLEPSVEPTSEPTATPAVEPEQDFYSKYGVKTLPKQVNLPSCAEKTETANLYRLNIDVGDVQGLSGFSVVNDRMFCYDQMVGEFCLYDFNEGKLLCKVSEQEGYMQAGRLLNGGFWTCVMNNLETTFYDAEGIPTVKRKAETNCNSSVSYVTLDGKYELYNNEKGELLVYDFSNGKAKVIYSAGGYYQLITETNQGCIFSIDGKNYILIDPGAGTIKTVYDYSKDDTEMSLFPMWPFFYYDTEDDVTLCPAEDTSKRVTVHKKEKQQFPTEFSYGILTGVSSGETSSICFYNLRTEELIGEIIAPENTLFGSLKTLDNGFSLISCQKDNKIELYLYDLVSERETKKWPVTKSERVVEVETNPVVKELNETYGVKVFYGEKCIIKNVDKDVDTITDEKQIDNSIKILKKFLEQLPKGMTQEMYEGNKRGLDIYLSGKIKNRSETTQSVGGFCFLSDKDKISVVVDATCSDEMLYSTLAHEFSHAFEYRIQDVLHKGGSDWLMAWEKLLPSSIKKPYYETYDIGSKGMEYTPYGTKKEIWFADSYSRTFPTEDRARMFEYMFIPEKGKISWYIDFDNLKYKARFYSLMLRSCFESCREAKDLVWEQYIGKIDSKEFSSLIDYDK